MLNGHEEIEDMTLVEHGKFSLIAESLGWDTRQLEIAADLLSLNDERSDADGCEGA